MQDGFRKISRKSAEWFGTTWAFLAALTTIVVWIMAGPYFRFSDTWQLVMNTATSIVTFLMVFLIQNTQNRDTMSIHLKLDELIRSTRRANNSMIDLERLSDEELKILHERYLALGAVSSGGSTKTKSEPSDSPSGHRKGPPPGPAAS